MNTLDKVLMWLAVFLFAFIVCMIILFCIYQSVPDTLISCVCGGGAIEAILTAWITVTKKKMQGDKDNEMDD